MMVYIKYRASNLNAIFAELKLTIAYSIYWLTPHKTEIANIYI